MRATSAQTVIEFAVALPVFLLLILGAVQFGLWYHAESVVQAATREGAHAAALEGSAPQDGVATARRLISASLGQFGANVELDASSDDEVAVVAASGSMRPILPLPVLGQSLPLGARAIAYREMFRP